MFVGPNFTAGSTDFTFTCRITGTGSAAAYDVVLVFDGKPDTTTLQTTTVLSTFDVVFPTSNFAGHFGQLVSDQYVKVAFCGLVIVLKCLATDNWMCAVNL